MVFRQQKNVTAARLAGGKHIYINLTKLTELAETYREAQKLTKLAETYQTYQTRTP